VSENDEAMLKLIAFAGQVHTLLSNSYENVSDLESSGNGPGMVTFTVEDGPWSLQVEVAVSPWED
jgi:hypothetical protein